MEQVAIDRPNGRDALYEAEKVQFALDPEMVEVLES